MNTMIEGRDPTMPKAPAFTKLVSPVDIMERQNARLAKGGLAGPMLLARLTDAMKMRKGKTNGRSAS